MDSPLLKSLSTATFCCSPIPNLNLRPTPSDAASVALFRHLAGRDDYRKIVSLLDHTQPTGKPAFFSGDLWSLSAIFANVREVEIRKRDAGSTLRETVSYRMR
jgi:hypothetical protein